VQFLYGEDGMDGTAIESQRVEHLRMDARRLRARARARAGKCRVRG